MSVYNALFIGRAGFKEIGATTLSLSETKVEFVSSSEVQSSHIGLNASSACKDLLGDRPASLQPVLPMKNTKQLQLFKSDLRVFGGQLLHGKRRVRRPLSTKEPVHLVMRSSWAGGAMGATSFLAKRNKQPIHNLIHQTGKTYGIRIYQVALVGNHLHLVVRISHREKYKSFVRVLAGRIASHVMRDQSFEVFKCLVLSQMAGDPPKAHPGQVETQGKGQAFWQFRPWTRVLYWERDYRTCCNYVKQNVLEALGFIEYQPRKHKYTSSEIMTRNAINRRKVWDTRGGPTSSDHSKTLEQNDAP